MRIGKPQSPNKAVSKDDIQLILKRFDTLENRLINVEGQVYWLYKKAHTENEEQLIHDNHHKEMTETLLGHEKRIRDVETFVQAVSA